MKIKKGKSIIFAEWRDEYSVGVSVFDVHHNKILTMISDFYKRLKNNEDGLARLLDDVVDYSVYHFKAEEKCFERFKYPDMDSHIDNHKEFIKKISEVKTRFDAEKEVLSLEVTTFLKDWWVSHINNIDKKYSLFFYKHGLK